MGELEKQLNTSQSETAEKSRLELQQTKEQLQVHIQTIGECPLSMQYVAL